MQRRADIAGARVGAHREGWELLEVARNKIAGTTSLSIVVPAKAHSHANAPVSL